MGIRKHIKQESLQTASTTAQHSYSSSVNLQEGGQCDGYSMAIALTDATPAAKTFTDANVDWEAEKITLTAHGLLTGLKVQFSSTDTLPAPLLVSTDYYVIRSDADNFEVATSYANAISGTSIEFTDHGVGTHTVTPQSYSYKEFADSDVNVGSDYITETAHAFPTGLKGQFSVTSGALPTGITAGVDYYIIRDNANEFKLADSYANAIGGTQIDLSDGGNGTHTITPQSYTVKTFDDSDCNTDDTIDKVAHGLCTGQKVTLAIGSGALPTGLSAGVDYFIIRDDADNFKIADSLANAVGGTQIDLSDGGNGTQTFTPQSYSAVTFDDSDCNVDDTIDEAAHVLCTGMKCTLAAGSGALPAVLSAVTDYWVIRVDADNIQLASSWANAFVPTALNFADGGNGTHLITVQTHAAKNFASTDVDSAVNDDITITGHGFANGMKVQVSTSAGNLPDPLLPATDYYVIVDDADTIRLAASLVNALAGTEIDLTSDGVGTSTVTPQNDLSNKSFAWSDVDTGTEQILINAHGLITGQKVQVSNTAAALPTGLTAGDVYVIRSAAGEFKLAASLADALAGTALNITAVPTGGTGHTLTPANDLVAKDVLWSAFNAGTDVVAKTTHTFLTGLKVRVANSLPVLPTGLIAGDAYIIYVDADQFKLAASLADALAGTAMNISAVPVGGASHSVTPANDLVAKNLVWSDVVAGTDVCTISSHAFLTGLKVRLANASGVLPTGLSTSTDYYLVRSTADRYKVAASLADAHSATAIDITAAGVGGVSRFTPSNDLVAKDFDEAAVDHTDDNITITSHGFLTGLKVAATTDGTLPAGLSATNYYVIKVDANTIKLASSYANAVAGTFVDITAASGGGTHTLTPATLSVVMALQGSNDDSTWVDISTATKTASGNYLLDVDDPHYRYARIYWTIASGMYSAVVDSQKDIV